jgi:CheY-like chemotaxis protein
MRTGGRYGSGRSGRPLRVLVVDDTEPNRRLAQRMLETMGHSVENCASGPGALDLQERLASGMDDVLTKPYRSRDLYDAIERADVPRPVALRAASEAQADRP